MVRCEDCGIEGYEPVEEGLGTRISESNSLKQRTYMIF